MDSTWTQWSGVGYPKIEPSDIVEVMFREQTTDADAAGAFSWEWEDRPRDVIAYRDTDWRPE